MAPLRADAPVFVPTSWGQESHIDKHLSVTEQAEDQDYYSEVSITEDELAELDDMDNWIETLVELELAEQEHLVATALREAPPEAVQAIEERVAAKHGGAATSKKGSRKN